MLTLTCSPRSMVRGVAGRGVRFRLQRDLRHHRPGLSPLEHLESRAEYGWAMQPREEGLAQLAERKITETIEAEEEMDDGDGFVSAIWDEGVLPNPS